MPQKTATAPAPLDEQALSNLDDHDLVRAAAASHREIRENQRLLNDELIKLRQMIYTAERGTLDAPPSPWELRRAQQRAMEIVEELDVMQAALFASTEALEAARSEARAELRPALKLEAAQVLRDVLTQAEALLAAQQDLVILEAQNRRLKIGLALNSCVDPFLERRIKGIRQLLERLEG
jgi:hypothetical protein